MMPVVDKTYKCDWCRLEKEERNCLEQVMNHKGRVFHCTRPSGHEGAHVACGVFTHPIAVEEIKNELAG